MNSGFSPVVLGSLLELRSIIENSHPHAFVQQSTRSLLCFHHERPRDRGVDELMQNCRLLWVRSPSLHGGKVQNEPCRHDYNCVSAAVVARRGGP